MYRQTNFHCSSQVIVDSADGDISSLTHIFLKEVVMNEAVNISTIK
jgi:hypothetical protein